jgi:hypothetical protein
MLFSPGPCYKLELKVLTLGTLRAVHVETLQSRLVTEPGLKADIPVCKSRLKALTAGSGGRVPTSDEECLSLATRWMDACTDGSARAVALSCHLFHERRMNFDASIRKCTELIRRFSDCSFGNGP